MKTNNHLPRVSHLHGHGLERKIKLLLVVAVLLAWAGSPGRAQITDPSFTTPVIANGQYQFDSAGSTYIVGWSADDTYVGLETVSFGGETNEINGVVVPSLTQSLFLQGPGQGTSNGISGSAVFQTVTLAADTSYTLTAAEAHGTNSNAAAPFQLDVYSGTVTDFSSATLLDPTNNQFNSNTTNSFINYSVTFTTGASGTVTILLDNTGGYGTQDNFSTVSLAENAVGTTYTLTTAAGSTLLHEGATTSLTTTITNTGGSGTDTLNYSGLGATSGLGNGISSAQTTGGPLANGGGSAANGQTYTATNAGSDLISANGTGTNATLGGDATLGSSTGPTIIVYSGQGVWNHNGGGSWGTISATPANWTALGGTPGVTPDVNFISTDSATFDNTALSNGSSAVVTLDGENPSLNAITFNTVGGGYTVAQGSTSGGAGSIYLNGGLSSATVTDSSTGAATAIISAPVSLTTSANVNVASGQHLTFSGIVSGNGGLATTTGTGTTELSNSNTYHGGTTVGAGTLLITNGTNGSATGSGSLTVNGGATLAGNGTSSGTSFSISGNSSSNRANVLVGLSSTTDASVSTNMALTGTAASTISNANLTFNLNAGAVGGSGNGTSANAGAGAADTGNELLVDTTAITFSGAVTLTLNLQDGGSITPHTPYVLFAGTGSGDGADGSQYSGIGTTLINGQNVITSGLNLTFSSDGSTYAPSNLVLYQAPGVDDIEVLVIPEPSTWAMMLGGLALLVFIQRRRRIDRIANP